MALAIAFWGLVLANLYVWFVAYQEWYVRWLVLASLVMLLVLMAQANCAPGSECFMPNGPADYP